MEKKNDNNPGQVPPDLKHDTMEYTAATDGDDELDVNEEEDDISAGELDALENNDTEEDAYALMSAETDSSTDEDNFLAAPEEEDEFEEDKKDDLDI